MQTTLNLTKLKLGLKGFLRYPARIRIRLILQLPRTRTQQKNTVVDTNSFFSSECQCKILHCKHSSEYRQYCVSHSFSSWPITLIITLIFQVDLHCVLHRVATSSCRGHFDELATEPFLLLHREHGTGYRRSWNCCDRRTCFAVNWKHFCFILSTGTRIRTDSVMCPRSSSSGRNTIASVTVTVTYFHERPMEKWHRVTVALIQLAPMCMHCIALWCHSC